MTDDAHSAALTPKRDQRRHSISAKIIFLVFLCTFSTALVISGIAVHATHRQLREKIDAGFPEALERSRIELAIWFAEGTTALQALRSAPASRAYLEALGSGTATGEQRAAALAMLSDFETASLHFDGMALLSTQWKWIAHTPGFEPAMEARITTPLEAENPQQWAVLSTDPPATVKIITVNGANAADGYLVARYDRALLELLLSAEKHDAPGRLMLTDPNGRVLAAVGGEASESEFFDSPAILRQQGSAGAVMDYANAAGIHSLAAWLPLATPSSQDWMLVIAAPFASAFAPAYDLVARIFLADLVIILLFITVAYRITSRMLRPIENLSEGARLASSGKFGQTISDPGTHDEIGRLTRAFNEMMGKLHESQSDLQSANNQLKNQNGELQKANEVLSQLSITDGLTKLHNHRYFQEILIREIKRQTRTQKPLSMLLVDLDDFKTLNDRLGHASGDELLMRVASIMDASVRDSDLLARYGGEEFVVLATDTDLEGAVRLAEKIRMAVEQARHIVNDSLRPVRITVSVGVAQYSGNRRLFFESADRALYRAKDQGKNCVIAAAEDGPLD